MDISKPKGQAIILKLYYPRGDGNANKTRKHVKLNNSYLHFSVSSFHT